MTPRWALYSHSMLAYTPEKVYRLDLRRVDDDMLWDMRCHNYYGAPLTDHEVEALVLLANTFGLEVMWGTLKGMRPDTVRVGS